MLVNRLVAVLMTHTFAGTIPAESHHSELDISSVTFALGGTKIKAGCQMVPRAGSNDAS